MGRHPASAQARGAPSCPAPGVARGLAQNRSGSARGGRSVTFTSLAGGEDLAQAHGRRSLGTCSWTVRLNTPRQPFAGDQPGVSARLSYGSTRSEAVLFRPLSPMDAGWPLARGPARFWPSRPSHAILGPNLNLLTGRAEFWRNRGYAMNDHRPVGLVTNAHIWVPFIGGTQSRSPFRIRRMVYNIRAKTRLRRFRLWCIDRRLHRRHIRQRDSHAASKQNAHTNCRQHEASGSAESHLHPPPPSRLRA